MLLSWIVKTFPRSPRAFLAFLVMIGSTTLLFSALSSLFDPSSVNASNEGLKFLVGAIIGIPSTGLFYYWQHMDEAKRHDKSELDILNSYAEAENRERIYKQSTATPVFSSQMGALGQKRSDPAPTPTDRPPAPPQP